MKPNDELIKINPQYFANENNYPEKYEEFCNIKEYTERNIAECF